MKNLFRIDRSGRASLKTEGFTLPEALISVSLFLLLLGGVVSANLFGMRMFQLSKARLKANDGVRKAFGVLADEIRTCDDVKVGNVTNGTFLALLDGETQTGSALFIQASTNATNYVVYFFNPTDQSLSRFVNITANVTVLLQSVTNADLFSAQDCFGNVLTNSQKNRVIHATLDFVQSQPWLPVSEYSRLETSVTRRISD